MAITFHPNPGTILECDYSGMKEPEMVKKRPVLVISPRSRIHGLVTVVAISTTAPHTLLPWHYSLILPKPLAPSWPECEVWIKGDMINTFRLARFDRFHTKTDSGRKYYDRRISDQELTAVRQCVAAFLLR